jgi:elongation factor P
LISPNDFKPGLTIELDGRVLQVVSADHHKPGRGQAIVRTQLRDITTGDIFSKTFRPSENVARAHVDRRDMQFLYMSGDSYVFMDTEDYEQQEIAAHLLGDRTQWLKEGETVAIATYKGNFVDIEVPRTVDRKVTRTDPGLRGDTAQGGTKPAVIEGGATVQVPLFVAVDDIIRVDTETGAYVSRVSS